MKDLLIKIGVVFVLIFDTVFSPRGDCKYCVFVNFGKVSDQMAYYAHTGHHFLFSARIKALEWSRRNNRPAFVHHGIIKI